ncbi:MAG: porin family protein [Nonlabens sp.]
MKKQFIYSLFMGLFMISVNAQDTQQQSFKLYGIAGMNLSKYVGDDVRDEVENRFSPRIGLGTSFELSPTVTFKPEIIYSTQGYRSTVEFVTVNGDIVVSEDRDLTARADYLIIPANFMFNVADRLSLYFGPQAGFNLNESSKIEGEDETIESDQLQSFYLAANLGLQYSFENRLGLRFSYQRGLTRVFRDFDATSIGGNFTEFDAYQSVFALELTYQFL